jgi:hypothetical protein
MARRAHAAPGGLRTRRSWAHLCTVIAGLAAGLESWAGCRGHLTHIQAALIAHGPYITRPAPPEIGGGTPNPTSPWRSNR